MKRKMKAIISIFLICTLFSNNLFVLSAPIVDPNAPISFQPNISEIVPNTHLINIVNPNTQGISHNKYDSFNTNSNESVIFNNSMFVGNSSLFPSLSISANPNLSVLANTILNEITGSVTSSLSGLFEIFGGKANLIFANPNGLSINGASFLNTNTLSLVAGSPIYDSFGNLSFSKTSTLNINNFDTSGVSSISNYAKTINNNANINMTGNNTDSEYHYVDYNTINPNTTPGRIFIAVDSDGNLMGQKQPKWEIKDGKIVYVAETLNNNGSISSNDEVVIDTQNLNNNGYIQGKQLTLNLGSLRNTGGIYSDNDLNLYLPNLRNETLLLADQRRPNGGINENINYSLLNFGSIQSNSNLNIFANRIDNRGGEIFSWNKMNITSNNLINESTGLYTQQIGEYQADSERFNKETGYWELKKQYYLYYVDRKNGNDGYIGSLNDLSIDSDNTINKGSVLETGGNLSITGDSFTNNQDILKVVQRNKWLRKSLFSTKWREVWRQRTLGSTGGLLTAMEDAEFNLTNNFANNGIIDITGNLSINARNITNGIIDPNILTPVDELPDIQNPANYPASYNINKESANYSLTEQLLKD